MIFFITTKLESSFNISQTNNTTTQKAMNNTNLTRQNDFIFLVINPLAGGTDKTEQLELIKNHVEKWNPHLSECGEKEYKEEVPNTQWKQLMIWAVLDVVFKKLFHSIKSVKDK